MIEDKIFWHKYRPTSVENKKGEIKMILLPRIKKIIQNIP